MQVHFPDGMNQQSLEDLITALKRNPAAHDDHSALFDARGSSPVAMRRLSEVARRARQPVTLSMHSPGEEVVLSDGTRYRVHHDGSWRRVREGDSR